MKGKWWILICGVIVSVLIFVCVFRFILFPKKYKNEVFAFADEYGIERSLVFAVIKAESGFDKNAVSGTGARGLMQIMPSTADWIAEVLDKSFEKDDLFKPNVNIEFGCFYLSYLILKFKFWDVAVVAYNAGEGVARKWIDENGKLDRNKIDYSETKNYLSKVERYMKIYEKDFLF